MGKRSGILIRMFPGTIMDSSGSTMGVPTTFYAAHVIDNEAQEEQVHITSLVEQ